MIGGLFDFASDAWNALVGKSQGWYTNVSNIQNRLSVLMAGVEAVGSSVWDFVGSQSAQGPSQDGGWASGVAPHASVVSAIDEALTSIIVTKSHVPSDQAISQAAATASEYERELDYVKGVAPEVAEQVSQDEAQAKAMLPKPMSSPQAVGKDAFAKELEDRAKSLGQGVSGILWAAAAFVGLTLLATRGGAR